MNQTQLITPATLRPQKSTGGETKIYIQPVSVTIDAGNGAVSMAVWVSVHYAKGVAPWSITPITQNTMDGRTGISRAGQASVTLPMVT
jgi:hypothetical protein